MHLYSGIALTAALSRDSRQHDAEKKLNASVQRIGELEGQLERDGSMINDFKAQVAALKDNQSAPVDAWIWISAALIVLVLVMLCHAVHSWRTSKQRAPQDQLQVKHAQTRSTSLATNENEDDDEVVDDIVCDFDRRVKLK